MNDILRKSEVNQEGRIRHSQTASLRARKNEPITSDASRCLFHVQFKRSCQLAVIGGFRSVFFCSQETFAYNADLYRCKFSQFALTVTAPICLSFLSQYSRYFPFYHIYATWDLCQLPRDSRNFRWCSQFYWKDSKCVLFTMSAEEPENGSDVNLERKKTESSDQEQ